MTKKGRGRGGGKTAAQIVGYGRAAPAPSGGGSKTAGKKKAKARPPSPSSSSSSSYSDSSSSLTRTPTPSPSSSSSSSSPSSSSSSSSSSYHSAPKENDATRQIKEWAKTQGITEEDIARVSKSRKGLGAKGSSKYVSTSSSEKSPESVFSSNTSAGGGRPAPSSNFKGVQYSSSSGSSTPLSSRQKGVQTPANLAGPSAADPHSSGISYSSSSSSTSLLGRLFGYSPAPSPIAAPTFNPPNPPQDSPDPAVRGAAREGLPSTEDEDPEVYIRDFVVKSMLKERIKHLARQDNVANPIGEGNSSGAGESSLNISSAPSSSSAGGGSGHGGPTTEYGEFEEMGSGEPLTDKEASILLEGAGGGGHGGGEPPDGEGVIELEEGGGGGGQEAPGPGAHPGGAGAGAGAGAGGAGGAGAGGATPIAAAMTSSGMSGGPPVPSGSSGGGGRQPNPTKPLPAGKPGEAPPINYGSGQDTSGQGDYHPPPYGDGSAFVEKARENDTDRTDPITPATGSKQTPGTANSIIGADPIIASAKEQSPEDVLGTAQERANMGKGAYSGYEFAGPYDYPSRPSGRRDTSLTAIGAWRSKTGEHSSSLWKSTLTDKGTPAKRDKYYRWSTKGGGKWKDLDSREAMRTFTKMDARKNGGRWLDRPNPGDELTKVMASTLKRKIGDINAGKAGNERMNKRKKGDDKQSNYQTQM